MWKNFLEHIKKNCTKIEYENWFSNIKLISETTEKTTIEVPNIFVKEYLLTNYKDDLNSFLQTIEFEISKTKKIKPIQIPKNFEKTEPLYNFKLNKNYTFENFIEGPCNQFIKAAALGISKHPGSYYNPLFIHGGVGLGKTHLLHAIGHYTKTNHKKLKIQCITTEAFINDIVTNLKSKTMPKMKHFYRNLDVFLIDDIQFLQNRLNFEEEFCNTFESLINQNKQIVITSDKAPALLQLSERMIARMQCGLVAHIGIPDIETRVAILQHKAEKKGLKIPSKVAFFIAEHIYNNIRQLEGAINRLNAYCKLMNLDITQDVVENTLCEMFQKKLKEKISVDKILKIVASMYKIQKQDIIGPSKIKEITVARQIAMYLAKELMSESLIKLAKAFGRKTHSTLLHAWKKISKQIENDENLRDKIQTTKHTIESKT